MYNVKTRHRQTSLLSLFLWPLDFYLRVSWLLTSLFILLLLYSWYRLRQLRKTIDQQQQTIDQFAEKAELLPTIPAIPPPEPVSPSIPVPLPTKSELTDEFLIRVYGFVEQHLADSTLSVELLAGAMHMSRMNLHRKLKAQTGLSANELIRSIRLQRAAVLLLTNTPISTVSYTVGIESPAYFSRIFKEEFGCTPSDYLLINCKKK